MQIYPIVLMDAEAMCRLRELVSAVKLKMTALYFVANTLTDHRFHLCGLRYF